MKNRNLQIIVILFLFLYLLGCTHSTELIWENFNSNIVFRRDVADLSQLVFVNSNGDEIGQIKTDLLPGWISINHKGNVLYFIYNTFPPVRNKAQFDHGLQIAMVRGNGIRAWCDFRNKGPLSRYAFPVNDENLVYLLQQQSRIIEYDIENCKLVRTIFELPANEKMSLWDFSFSPDQNNIAYSLFFPRTAVFEVHIFNLQTNESKVIAEGIAPNYSPDGKYIAFTGLDGIYLFDVKKEEKIKIADIANWEKDLTFFTALPAPRWSPCGDSIIFHYCHKESEMDCYHIDQFSIYKVDLASKVESIIANNGIFPTWIKQTCP